MSDYIAESDNSPNCARAPLSLTIPLGLSNESPRANVKNEYHSRSRVNCMEERKSPHWQAGLTDVLVSIPRQTTSNREAALIDLKSHKPRAAGTIKLPFRELD
jgi:hypothetical protein